MPPCRLRQRIFRKFDYEMVHSEVYLNKYVVSLAPFSTPAYPPFRKLLFCMFLLFNFFHPFFRGSADSVCPYVQTPMSLTVHYNRPHPMSPFLSLLCLKADTQVEQFRQIYGQVNKFIFKSCVDLNFSK